MPQIAAVTDIGISILMIAVGAVGVWTSAWLVVALRGEDILYRLEDVGADAAWLLDLLSDLLLAEVFLLLASIIYVYGAVLGSNTYINVAETMYLAVAFIAVVALRWLERRLV